MLKTIINENTYQDSVVLMLLTNEISTMEGVNKVSIMMATPANKDIFEGSGLRTPELEEATANDMAIVLDADNDEVVEKVLVAVDEFLDAQSKSSGGKAEVSIKSWEAALKELPDANLAVVSVPGVYAASVANRALDEDLNVFIFSDNVKIEDEVALKEKAKEKGLLCMGPDSGTGVINSVPVAFTNNIKSGRIGVVGASGTGIQEVTTIIDRLGEGVTNAIGTGGRDLSEEVGGITMLSAVAALAEDDSTDVITLISKPPAKEVRDRIMNYLRSLDKPVVTIFLGENPQYHEGNIYHAYTLEEAARISVALARREEVEQFKGTSFDLVKGNEDKTIKAYYSGGTLAGEAAMLINESIYPGQPIDSPEDYMLKKDGHEVIDLGDDKYTQGKPHPMIDPTTRAQYMENAMEDKSTGVILFDLVLGYGSHEDMANALAPSIEKLKAQAKEENREVHFITTICGTKNDPQGYDKQKQIMEDIGVIVCETNNAAVEKALSLLGKSVEYKSKEMKEKSQASEKVEVNVADGVRELITSKPRIINVGLKSFSETLESFPCEVVQYDWKPVAGGDVELIKVLDYLRSQKEIDEHNRAVIDKIVASSPVLLDVVPAKDVIKELDDRTLLHAGPPIKYENMPDPVQGSCVGAILFEGWADTEEGARELLESGQINLIPCHHVDAVGPMGGITSANMPVFVVEDTSGGNRAYCIMNEGIGKVLRFGAYSEEVVNRLHWMADVLGPTLGKALRTIEGGLSVNPLIARAIAMGDEFHQRNIAASLVFLKEMSPIIVELDMDEKEKQEVITFLADTDQFFLNIAMAATKAVMDNARTIEHGTVVTAMCRNGENFGIRIAGMGDEWFTGPVNTPQGLYFSGYSAEDANPDIGDSAITETFGIGGMAMIAAPAVTRFVGTGGFSDALNTSNEMMEICLDHNPNFIVPTWDFQGTCLGIDARKVVETGITPVINTGIAHKVAGMGQIGAGTVNPPLECFEKAVKAYAEKLGYKA